MPLYREEAVVLRSYKLGEADRIVVFFSRGRGKVRGVAKGARRTKSRFGSKLEPGAILQLQLYEGRNLDTVTQAERVEPLLDMRANFARAAVLLESIDAVANEDDPNPAMYKLLTGALRELDRTGNALVVPAFVGRLLTLEGVQPHMESCVSCGAPPPIVTVDASAGGVFCSRCRRGHPISEPARVAFAQVLAGQVRHVLDTTTDSVAAELEALAARMVEQHIERRLKSAMVLHDQMEIASEP